MLKRLALGFLFTAAVFNLMGCEDSSSYDSRSNFYEQVKLPRGEKLYKVQIFCPGKTYNYLTTDDYVIDSSKRVEFKDYSTSFKIKSSCPSIVLPVVRKVEDIKMTKEQMEKMYLDGQNISIVDEDKNLETTSKLPQSIIINNTTNNTIEK